MRALSTFAPLQPRTSPGAFRVGFRTLATSGFPRKQSMEVQMRTRVFSAAKCIVLAVAGLVVTVATPANADVVTDWNQTAMAVMKAADVGGNPWTRNMAMMHVAMSDAINSVHKKYSIYAANEMAAPGASAEAAAAAAARGVLLQQVPGQKASIERAFEVSTKPIADGPAKKEGITLGEKCAAAVLADRASDGTNAPDTYRPVTQPGVWIPTTPPLFAQYARAKPWVMTSTDQVRPPPPPDLKSERYARAYTETKDLGAAKSAKRTPEQTQAVKFWTQTNFGPAWEDAARQLSDAKKLSLAENARLFALLNMGIANTFIADWDAKFTYNFWRPITAIRNADLDGNDATERDPGWTSLNANPMHPEYPSQAAIIAGLAMGVFESVFGPNPATPIVATDATDPKLQRRFTNIRAMADEVQNVRVWGGIHFRTSLEVGYDMGQKIADYLIENSLKPNG
jgi:hypothetical protein